VLLTGCGSGGRSSQPFDLGDGFEKAGEVNWDEDLLSLDLAKRSGRSNGSPR
jgi:hypothetical protein